MATKTNTKKKVPAKKAPAAVEFSAGKTKGKTAPAKKKATGKSAPATKGKGKATPAAKKAVPAKKSAAKKDTVSKARGGQALPRVLNEHGFVVGSDSEKIVNILLEGGAGRNEVNTKVLKALGNKQTKNGQAPNVSSLIANILKRLREKGYTIESQWQLVPPTPASKAAATRAAKKRAVAATPPQKAVSGAVKPQKRAVSPKGTGRKASKAKA
jgi:hypothetical protein